MLKAGDFAGLETSWWFILCSAVCLCLSLWLSVNCSSGVVTGGAGGGTYTPGIFGCSKFVEEYFSCPEIFIQKCIIWGWKLSHYANLWA